MAVGCEGSQLWGVGVWSEVRTGAWGAGEAAAIFWSCSGLSLHLEEVVTACFFIGDHGTVGGLGAFHLQSPSGRG